MGPSGGCEAFCRLKAAFLREDGKWEGSQDGDEAAEGGGAVGVGSEGVAWGEAGE